ncbi:hypothetical protein SLEP1_g12206 [Rubroshorea leprosula]|uniref:RRM domain-containing protein n=1 Tax=Rubroshorea leprosula TaxID=152421 RepID=A0AAV5IHG5_9ROSI|nr:hypothetical protein SLEP1_g12206 [Rubroshorea leprosula]
MARERQHRKTRRYQQRVPVATGQGDRGRFSLARKQRQRFNGFANFSVDLLMNSWSFHFSNFPEERNSGMLWGLFTRYGKLLDVHISKKRDSSGGKYGFVRFLNVTSTSALEERLNRVWIDNFHLRALFNPEQEKRAESGKERGKMKWVAKGSAPANRESGGEVGKAEGKHRGIVGVHKTFLEVLKGDPHKQVEQKRESVNSCGGVSSEGVFGDCVKGSKVIECTVEEKEYDWLNACAIGYVTSLEVISSLQVFEMEGIFNIVVVPMGGCMVLLRGDNTAQMKELVVLKVNGQPFQIYVSEENWRADPEWWMCGKSTEAADGEGEDLSFSNGSSNVERHYVEEDEEVGWSESLEAVEEMGMNFPLPETIK